MMIKDERQTLRSRQERASTPGALSEMQAAITRTLLLTVFTLMEYYRSGRVLVELGISAGFFVIFLRGGNAGIEGEKFFSLAGIFILALTIYTTSSVVGLGDRPQGYIVLARQVARAEYILSLYFASLVLILGIFGLLSAATAILSDFTNLTVTDWLLGTLPLMLNVGLLGALLLVLSPLVLSTGWRLFLLGLIALAFSKNFFGNAALETLPPTVQEILNSIQTILSWPMVPAFSGFALAMSRDYSGNAPAILVAQSSLLIALLGLSIYSFSRREVILQGE
jgi:hypothetical protein